MDQSFGDQGPGGERSAGEEIPDAIAAIAALDDPTRQALYRYVVGAGEPVGREQAAAALGLAHHVARFHLDRLFAVGLLQVDYQRPSGRGGPGAGHPTKLYRAATTECAVSLPDRRYAVAGAVLSRAVATAMRDGSPISQALQSAAADTGRQVAARVRRPGTGVRQPGAAFSAALEGLDSVGFAPRAAGDAYVLANCPFRRLANDEPEVICHMNLALVRGLLEEIGVASTTAQLDPAEGRCCVTLASVPGS